LLPKNIEIAVIGANLVEDALRVVPLIEHGFDLVLPSSQQEPRFYRDVLGMELLYGGEGTRFCSLCAKDTQSAILNLEQGKPVTRWGRLIFYVADVDAIWNHLRDRGFDPEIPRDATWGERCFHLRNPDGHELSFAWPLR
jgi:hypothetical protein